ncbi:MAG: hypothetical protein SPI30_04795 [Prevotella sp.]|nr:hypothetical protein [Prevotella sp.]
MYVDLLISENCMVSDDRLGITEPQVASPRDILVKSYGKVSSSYQWLVLTLPSTGTKRTSRWYTLYQYLVSLSYSIILMIIRRHWAALLFSEEAVQI